MSFHPNTYIVTTVGYKRISDLLSGDLVVSPLDQTELVVTSVTSVQLSSRSIINTEVVLGSWDVSIDQFVQVLGQGELPANQVKSGQRILFPRVSNSDRRWVSSLVFTGGQELVFNSKMGWIIGAFLLTGSSPQDDVIVFSNVNQAFSDKLAAALQPEFAGVPIFDSNTNTVTVYDQALGDILLHYCQPFIYNLLLRESIAFKAGMVRAAYDLFNRRGSIVIPISKSLEASLLFDCVSEIGLYCPVSKGAGLIFQPANLTIPPKEPYNAVATTHRFVRQQGIWYTVTANTLSKINPTPYYTLKFETGIKGGAIANKIAAAM